MKSEGMGLPFLVKSELKVWVYLHSVIKKNVRQLKGCHSGYALVTSFQKV